MAEVRAADVIREMLWKVIRETGLTEEELTRWLEGWYCARAADMRMEAPEPPWRSWGMDEAAKSTPESTSQRVEKVHPEGVESTPESTPADGVQNGPPARDNPEIGRKAYAARKANMRDALDRVRASGVSMQSIADSSGLTLNDVLDFLENKPVPLPKLARLGKGLGKLEGKDE